jgi:hypothetical protein
LRTSCATAAAAPGHYESQCYAKSRVENEGVYVLQNAEGRVYVGQSVDISRRIGQHADGSGARYTSEHRGWRRMKPSTAAADESVNGYGRENLETLHQTARHGEALVRGGSFCKREESERDLAVRRRMMQKEFE